MGRVWALRLVKCIIILDYQDAECRVLLATKQHETVQLIRAPTSTSAGAIQFGRDNKRDLGTWCDA